MFPFHLSLMVGFFIWMYVQLRFLLCNIRKEALWACFAMTPNYEAIIWNMCIFFSLADLSLKRKFEKAREKVLQCNSLSQRNLLVQPIPNKKSKKNKKAAQIQNVKDGAQ